MSERREAISLAQRVLDRPNADPDDDLAILARQFLRYGEVIDNLKADLSAMYDPTREMIEANRDAILRITEEGLRRVRKLLTRCLRRADGSTSDDALPESVAISKALKVIDAVNTFHPMHGESWGGWPEDCA